MIFKKPFFYLSLIFFLLLTPFLCSSETKADGFTGLPDQCADDGNWYYYVDGAVAYDVTTIACNSYGWWYVRNGVVDFSADTVAPNEYGWWVIRGGSVDFNYNGIANNEYGSWYCISGYVCFDANGLYLLDNYGDYGWWHIVNGAVSYTDTVAPNEYGWWAVDGGKVNFSAWGVYSNEYGSWYVEGGKVDFSVNGLRQAGDLWYLFNGGAVLTGYTGIVSNEYGDWYVENGVVRFDFTGIAGCDFNGSFGWWYISNGMLSYRDTVAENENGWWCIRNGMVDFGYTGLAANINGLWYCVNGQVDFSYNGTCRYNGSLYQVNYGRATLIRSAISKNNNRIWIGDSRTDCIKSLVGNNENDYFICRKEARYDYFEQTALPELINCLNSGNYDSVVIMMGVNDVIDHPYDYGTIAQNYINIINTLVNEYPWINFYVASVYYIDGTYIGSITSELNPSIKTFNSIMYNYCTAHYMPVAEFVQTTGLKSEDGLHITGSGAVDIYYAITSAIAF